MTLSYVPEAELCRLRELDAEPVARAAAFADACRINVLYMVALAGSGHLGTSFSAIDVLSWLHLEVLGAGDRCFSSKGHDAPATYAVLIGSGELPFDQIHALRRHGGLPGHPDVVVTPAVVTSTGSLGMGVSKARGFVLADRLAGHRGEVFVITGDGELQEGQFWESLQPTANRGLGEITVVVDHNAVQSDTWVDEVSDLGDLEARVAACGWAVARCDGNDIAAFSATLQDVREREPGRPKLIVADTLKGAGVSFMEPHDLPRGGHGLYGYHSGAPSAEDYGRALEELHARLDERLAALGQPAITLEHVVGTARTPPPPSAQRVVAAYGRALLAAAGREPRLVALDADLRLDTGLVEFARRHPDRFFECGIAEQDMVSQAGTMALAGLLPAVHSFACFLTPRANEQVYNNAVERTRVIYAGSLAGIVPGGPGHSHQSVRDIALMGCVPGMALLEPFCEREAELCVAWAVEEATGPAYIRLVSVPWDLGFEPPALERLEPGRGTVLREGSDGVLVGTGPVVVSQAYAAAEQLAAEGARWAVVALPWLRDVDGAWLAGVARGAPVVCIDNHVLRGGQGDAVHAALAGHHSGSVDRIGIEEVPHGGTNDEVLLSHGLDAASIAARLRAPAPALP